MYLQLQIKFTILNIIVVYLICATTYLHTYTARKKSLTLDCEIDKCLKSK